MESRISVLFGVFFAGLLGLVAPSVFAQNQTNADFKQGLQYYVKNNYEKAREKFEQAVARDTSAVKPQFFLGNVARRQGDTPAAIRQYRRVLSLDSDHTSAREKLASLYFGQKDWAKAEEHYRKLSRSNPDTFEFRFKLGISQFKQGELSAAKQNVLEAREMKPKSGPAHFYLGRILMRRQEYLNAASRFNRAIELNPSSGKYKFYRALAYFREEDYRSKRDSGWRSANGFQQAIKAGFDSPRTHFMYGNSLLNRGLYLLGEDRVKEGIDLLNASIEQFRRVLVSDWKASNAYHNMGVAYLAIGKLKLAKEAVENGILVEPSVPFFHDTLGEVYFRLGAFGKALESWKLARELDSNYDSHPFEPLYFARSLESRIEEAKLRR